MRRRWVPGVILAVGVLAAVFIPLHPPPATFSMSYPPPPHNYVLVRLGIAGVAAVVAMLLAGVARPMDRPRLWGGALILATAVGVALALPIGGPYIPTLPPYHGPMIRIPIPRYDLRNPLRIGVAGAGAVAAFLVALGDLHRSRRMTPPPRTQTDESIGG